MQTTSIPEDIIGTKFAADVKRRSSQYLLIARENITSYTDGTIIRDEKAESLRNGLLILMARLHPHPSVAVTIRTDPASGLRSLTNDETLRRYNIKLELGEPKNINKNPIAESAIGELDSELRRLQPLGGKITETTLARAIGNMNNLIRHNKLTAAEAWTKRDRASGDQIDIPNSELIKMKYNQRINNHESSAKHKSRGKVKSPYPKISVGQLVFLYSDYSKEKSRDKYMVLEVEDEHVWVKKFTNTQFRNRQYKKY